MANVSLVISGKLTTPDDDADSQIAGFALIHKKKTSESITYVLHGRNADASSPV